MILNLFSYLALKRGKTKIMATIISLLSFVS